MQNHRTTRCRGALSATPQTFKLLGAMGKLLLATFGLLIFATHLAPGQSLETLYSFQSTPDGAYPNPDLAVCKGNRFYGTTVNGGTFDNGTVFKLAPPAPGSDGWSETVLYSFTGGADGAFPVAGPIRDAAGALYGTTAAGGQFGLGTVYKLTPPTKRGSKWTETVLYSFQGGTDGANPGSPLLFDGLGAIYGTTHTGGISGFCSGGCGIVFRLAPPAKPGDSWAETVLYRFQAGADGYSPGGLVFGKNKALYGTTNSGGETNLGVVFRLAPNNQNDKWNLKVLYSFESGNAFAGYPQAALTFDRAGALYGPREAGGDFGYGFVYKLSPPRTPGADWSATLLYSFTPGVDGLSPLGRVVLDSAGTVYGTTTYGGSGNGIVYKLAPQGGDGEPWKETILHTFNGTDGSSPASTLRFDSSGALYGPASGGGQYNFGTIFRLQP